VRNEIQSSRVRAPPACLYIILPFPPSLPPYQGMAKEAGPLRAVNRLMFSAVLLYLS